MRIDGNGNGRVSRQSKAARFRQIVEREDLGLLMEAHDGMSARIVEEAGFEGIWASGLCISASMGLRDNNEASWTQVVDVLDLMSDASTIPVMVDADTGYGNFNNVRRLVRKLEQREIAAVCIEDKVFPKTNSYIHGERQPLADIDEFCGKIKAAKDTQVDPDFSVVARVEALIAGRSLDEALHRANAYREAGADAIVVHSKLDTADEILAFMRGWGDACPIIVIPTTYYQTPAWVLEDAGVSVAIFGNQLLRASITAMQRAAARMLGDRSTLAIEDEIANIAEVFRLQNTDELEQAEQRYLPVDRVGSFP